MFRRSADTLSRVSFIPARGGSCQSTATGMDKELVAARPQTPRQGNDSPAPPIGRQGCVPSPIWGVRGYHTPGGVWGSAPHHKELVAARPQTPRQGNDSPAPPIRGQGCAPSPIWGVRGYHTPGGVWGSAPHLDSDASRIDGRCLKGLSFFSWPPGRRSAGEAFCLRA